MTEHLIVDYSDLFKDLAAGNGVSLDCWHLDRGRILNRGGKLSPVRVDIAYLNVRPGEDKRCLLVIQDRGVDDQPGRIRMHKETTVPAAVAMLVGHKFLNDEDKAAFDNAVRAEEMLRQKPTVSKVAH